MHDGQMLFDSTQTWNKKEWKIDEVYTTTLARLAHEPFIVVGIHNDPPNRYAEFFPQKVAALMPDSYRNLLMDKLWNGELKADAYLNWIEQALVPFIEKEFQAGKRTKDRMVMGSSMGGLISLYALCEKPKLFGGAACLSIHTPMINYGMFEEGMVEALVVPFNIYLEKNLKTDKRHFLYVDRGTETLDASYKPYHDQLLTTLSMAGNLFTQGLQRTDQECHQSRNLDFSAPGLLAMQMEWDTCPAGGSLSELMLQDMLASDLLK